MPPFCSTRVNDKWYAEERYIRAFSIHFLRFISIRRLLDILLGILINNSAFFCPFLVWRWNNAIKKALNMTLLYLLYNHQSVFMISRSNWSIQTEWRSFTNELIFIQVLIKSRNWFLSIIDSIKEWTKKHDWFAQEIDQKVGFFFSKRDYSSLSSFTKVVFQIVSPLFSQPSRAH